MLIKFFEDVLSFVQALVWPGVIVGLALYFQESVKGLLDRLSSVTVAGNRVEFLEKEARLQQAKFVTGTLTRDPNNQLAIDAAKSLIQHDGEGPDGQRVAEWAKKNGADNPWDMGPKNWQRCLFDLGCAGGFFHELMKTPEGKLVYQ